MDLSKSIVFFTGAGLRRRLRMLIQEES